MYLINVVVKLRLFEMQNSPVVAESARKLKRDYDPASSSNTMNNTSRSAKTLIPFAVPTERFVRLHQVDEDSWSLALQDFLHIVSVVSVWIALCFADDVKRIFFSSSISYPPFTILCDEDAESKTWQRMDGLSFWTTRLFITIRILGQWMECSSYTIEDRDGVETYWFLPWLSWQFSLSRSPYLIRGRADPHSLMTVFFSRVMLRIHDSLLHA